MRSAWLLWSKPPWRGHAGVERVLAGVAERRVAEVVAERDRLGEVVVEPERAGERAGDLRHLDRMGEPGAEMVALVMDEHLGLVGEAAEGGRMDDAVAVALEFGARRRRRLGDETARRAPGRPHKGARSGSSASLGSSISLSPAVASFAQPAYLSRNRSSGNALCPQAVQARHRRQGGKGYRQSR